MSEPPSMSPVGVLHQPTQGCLAEQNRMPCTREQGHPGNHKTYGWPTGIVQIWSPHSIAMPAARSASVQP